ncbi:hypothetical protein PHLCEN_2v6020 [Hermanssonia centrifuga]|uniref:Non-reducing end beta-L-arabinofuranosidase-like GH127 middle domain-containing protein n=1 Tax=Hermanssonia centrifuga TaxID=98765 RepID=A0A2R6P0P3_9APHY|nr:hypothetical protein PHLCEN_2v6020 [Hermanssonia centrifuga]
MAGLVAPKKFLSLPLGAVKPAGWLHDQNGMVPNGVLMGDAKIQAQTQAFLDYVLDHQDATGWLGPEVNTTKPRYLWGRYPFFFGAIQMVEANPSIAGRVVPALHKFVSLANTMLHNGEGLEDWTNTRWEDFVITLQWLYDFHPDGQEDLLIDTMKMLKYTGDPWEDVFSPEYFPHTAVENLQNPFNVLTWHGVNMAEGLKALPSTYRFTHNQSGKLFTWMLPAPDGTYSSSTMGAHPEFTLPMSTLQASRQLEGNKVTASVDTLYPFSDTLSTTIKADKAFTYYVRIPSWVSAGTISVNGARAKSVAPSNGLHAVSIPAGTSTFVLSLPADITLESRPHGSVAVHRGPLHYAFDIQRTQKVLAQNSQQPMAIDLEFDSATAWQYAIDSSTLRFNSETPASGQLPSPIFDSGLPPFTITATACPINWTVAGDTFAASPPTNPACTGAATNITLWPFGATKLRIGEFPTFNTTG